VDSYAHSSRDITRGVAGGQELQCRGCLGSNLPRVRPLACRSQPGRFGYLRRGSPPKVSAMCWHVTASCGLGMPESCTRLQAQRLMAVISLLSELNPADVALLTELSTDACCCRLQAGPAGRRGAKAAAERRSDRRVPDAAAAGGRGQRGGGAPVRPGQQSSHLWHVDMTTLHVRPRTRVRL
jgi:hypothetical protein